MSKLNDIQMFYKVKTGKDVYLMPPRPKDSRVLDEDAKQTEARIKKGSRGPIFHDDPYAIAAAALINSRECEGGDPTGPPWGQGDFARGSECAGKRDALAAKIKSKMSRGKKSKKKTAAAAPAAYRPSAGRSSLPMAAMLKAVDDLTFDQDIRNILQKGCGCTSNPSEEDIEKVSNELASLMSAAAGWALSGDLTRGKDDHLNREWELAHKERLEREQREEDRRRERRERSRSRRMKKSSDFLALEEYYLMKDHSMVPPRQGLLWDAVKHRWTRPENVGRTVTEVQGSKRFRAQGTGAHERAVGGHGSGSVRGVQRGRKFRGTADVGHLRPHETTHASRRGLKGGKNLRRRGHKRSALTVLREHRRRQKRRT